MSFSPAVLIARIGWRNLVLGLAGAIVLVALEAFLHDPLGWRAAKVARLHAEAARASDEARARSIEAEGERQSAQRVTVLLKTAQAAEVATVQMATAAKAAPDADTRLDEARVARIRANDQALCEIGRLNGCPGVEP